MKNVLHVNEDVTWVTSSACDVSSFHDVLCVCVCVCTVLLWTHSQLLCVDTQSFRLMSSSAPRPPFKVNPPLQ